MKGLLFFAVLTYSTVALYANENPSDSTELVIGDSLYKDVGLNDSIDSNFDANLDSMLNLFYVDQKINIDSIELLNEDTNIPDFPDSVYIERLAAIPTVINLSYNPIVKRYIDVYSKKKRKSVEVMLGLSEYYFPIFNGIFDYYNIPNEMKYMSIIESALNPRAYSRARAVGLWQFMYGTGRLYGLEINSLIDERCDPIKSTDAAAKYARDLYSIYNDWILVIAAYNCGPGNVNRAIRRSGGKTNYWDIYYYLPRETRGHVPAFIAATYIMNYYSKHNLVPAKTDLPINSDTIQINEKLHLKQVSEVLGIPLQELRDLNPQYRSDIVPAGKKTYPLCIPAEYTYSFIDFEDDIFTYNDSVFFDPRRMVISPTSRPYSYFIPEAPGDDYVKLTYTVKSGDNLGYISSWYDVGISDIRYWNGIHRNMVRSGQKLAIYKHKNKADNYKGINKMTFSEKQSFIGKPVITAQTSEILQKNFTGEYIMYTVKAGDSLWDIAKKYRGVSDNDIILLNNITDVSKIKPGQQLKIMPKN
jgi:membrane-bound lytic murein transglycosylase D